MTNEKERKMENIELLNLLKDEVMELRKINKEQENDLKFKMAALNENFAGVYFGIFTENTKEQNEILMAKALEFYQNIGKDNFSGKTKKIVDETLKNNPFLAGKFEVVKNRYEENRKNYKYDEMLINGDFRKKEKVLEMISYSPIEYINIAKDWKKDCDIIKLALQKIESTGKFETDESFEKKLNIFHSQMIISGIKTSNILELGVKNAFIGKIFKKELINESKKTEMFVQLKQTFEKNPLFQLLSGVYSKKNEAELLKKTLNFISELPQDDASRNYVIFINFIEKHPENENIKKLISDEKIFLELNFEKTPASFIGLANQEILANPEILIKAVSAEKNIFKYLPKEIQDNRKIAMDFLNIAGKNYKLLNEKLKNDKEICELAVARSAKIYYYLPKEMKENIDIATLAINKDKWSWFLMEDNMKRNPEVLNSMRSERPSEYLNEAFRIHSKELGLEATSLKDKKALFKEMIALSPELIIDIPLKEATEELWFLALSKNIELYKKAPENIKNDERALEIVINQKKIEKANTR